MSTDVTSTLAKYRILVPAHAAIVDDTVRAFLVDAVMFNDADAWDDRFVNAMIYLAAHEIEMTPGLGSFGVEETGQVVMQRDGDLQRQYAQASAPEPSDADEYLKLTLYGRRVLRLRAETVGIIPIVAVPRDGQRSAILGQATALDLP